MQKNSREEGVSKELAPLVNDIAEEIFNTGFTVDELKRNGKYIAHKTTVPKAEYCRQLAELLCTPAVFNEYFESFSQEGKKIILDMVFKSAYFETDFLLEKFASKTKEYYHRDYEKLPFSFAIKYSRYSVPYIPPKTKACLRIQLAKLRPADLEITDDDFKKRRGYFSEKDGLEFFLNSVQIIQVLNDSGFFERSIGSPVLKSTLTKIKRIANFASFSFPLDEKDLPKPKYPDEEVGCRYTKKQLERMADARISLAVSFISFVVNKFFAQHNGKNILPKLLAEPEKAYREFLETFCTAQDAVFDTKILYPHVTLQSDYGIIAYRGKMMQNFITLVKQNPPVQATDFAYYIDVLTGKGLPHFFNTQSTYAYFKSAYDMYYDYADEAYIHYEKKRIDETAAYNAFVQLPAYNNLFLVLASLGLFEITWSYPGGSDASTSAKALQWLNEVNAYCYGKITYIKLTPLGAYVFGLTDKIKIEGVKSFAAPKLDENAFLIHIEEGDKTMEVFLEPFCTAISKTLYKVDEIRLKKYCKSTTEVETVFSTLGARAGNELPLIWKKLKDDITQSFVSFIAENDWLVISVEKESAEFIRFVEKLSHTGLCTKMEGKRIALKTAKYSQFVKKLEAEGFKV